MAKLTFEAQVQGMEKVLELLQKAQKGLYETSNAGVEGFDKLNSQVKDLHGNLDQLSKSQTSVDKILKEYHKIDSDTQGFLKQSSKKLLDNMKEGTDALRNEIKKIKEEIKKETSDLEILRKNKAYYDEEEFSKKQAKISQKINHLEAQQVTAATKVAQTERQIEDKYFQDRFEAGPFGRMQKYMGQKVELPFGLASTRGALIGGGLAALASVPTVMQGIGTATENWMMKDQRTFMAQRALNMQAANAAMSGDISYMFMQQQGLGAGAAAGQSLGVTVGNVGSYAMQNSLFRGAAVGAGGLGGAAALTAMGLMGPLGWMGLAGIAGAAGIAALTAPNKSYAQIQAEDQMRRNEEDAKLAAPVTNTAYQNLMRESQTLGLLQRGIGIGAAHDVAMRGLGKGYLYEEMAPALDALMATGMKDFRRVNSSFFGLRQRFGVSEALMPSLAETAALTGGTTTSVNAAMQLFANAGLYGTETYAARGMLSEYAGQKLQKLGLTGEYAAGVSSAVSNMVSGAAGVPTGMATKAAITMANTVSGAAATPGSAPNMAITSALISLGVTDPVAIQRFAIDLDITADSTHEEIAIFTGKDIKEVKKAIYNALGTWKDLSETVFGTSQSQKTGWENLKSKRGLDRTTQLMAGTAAANQAAKTGIGMTQAIESVARKPSGQTMDVQRTETFLDQRSKEEAGYVRSSFLEMERALSDVDKKLGKTVVTAISDAMRAGFTKAVEEMQKTTNELLNQRADRDTETKNKAAIEEVNNLMGGVSKYEPGGQ